MTNLEAIRLIRNLTTRCEFTDAYGEPIDSDAYYEAVDMAFSALQAQDSPKPTAESVQNVQNEDLILRKAAIDAPFKKFDMGTGVTWIPLEYIEQLPSAQPEPQWIPVSERVPDDLGDYLVSIKRIGWNMEEYVENDIAYWDDLEGFHKADEVLAWMPLPEPYRAERRTDD